MNTLSLKEAAIFLKMNPEVLRRQAAAGKIPAAKPGKRWCFIEEDLAEYLRSLYPDTAKTSWGVIKTERRKLWHSTKEEIPGGLPSATKEREYNKVLGLPIK